MTWHEWDEEVLQAATFGAARAARALDGVVELEDLEQEAQLWVATHPEEVQKVIDTYGVGMVATRVKSRMIDSFKRQRAAIHRSESLEVLRERELSG